MSERRTSPHTRSDFNNFPKIDLDANVGKRKATPRPRAAKRRKRS